MTIKGYRKKPDVIEAMEWDGTAASSTPIIDWILGSDSTARYHEAEPPKMHSMACRCDGRGIVPGPQSAVPCPETEPVGPGKPAHIAIDTLEGTMTASAGDFIIKGVQGEFYPCKPEIFKATYEEVDTDPEECVTCGALYGEMGHAPEPCEKIEET